MTSHPRREFLKLAAASLWAVNAYAKRAADSIVSAKPSKVNVWISSGSQRLAQLESLSWRTAANTQAIVLGGANEAPPILGFGAAFTDAACYMISRMPKAKQDALMKELFDPHQIGLSVCRVPMGSSDYSRFAYSYDEGEADPELKRFSIDHDLDYVIPTLRAARAINPELFLLGSPWSPPAWMKINNSMYGGTIRRRYLEAYADYFVKFLQAYRSEGVAINAVSSQNEVDTDQDGRMPACLFPQEIEVEFVGKHLGPALARAGIDTKIWLIDHNYNLWGRAIAELDDPDVRQYSNAIAWHGYVGDPNWILRVAAAHPTAEMHWTEGGPDFTDPQYATDWCKWSKTFAVLLRNGVRSIMGWNIALDEGGRPNIGPFPCGGLVTINSNNFEITRSGQYWAFAHYSRAIKRGSRVLSTLGAVDGVEHLAAQNPDGSYGVVLTNSSDQQQTIRIQSGAQETEVTLPADAVATLHWS